MNRVSPCFFISLNITSLACPGPHNIRGVSSPNEAVNSAITFSRNPLATPLDSLISTRFPPPLMVHVVDSLRPLGVMWNRIISSFSTTAKAILTCLAASTACCNNWLSVSRKGVGHDNSISSPVVML